MTRRRLLFGLLAAVVALAVVVMLWPPSAINRENKSKLRHGMTQAEVEAILGGPARDEVGGKPPRFLVKIPENQKEWIGPECKITVVFNEDGRAGAISSENVSVPPEAMLEKFRRWLRL